MNGSGGATSFVFDRGATWDVIRLILEMIRLIPWSYTLAPIRRHDAHGKALSPMRIGDRDARHEGVLDRWPL